jgi:hypothetical protein
LGGQKLHPKCIPTDAIICGPHRLQLVQTMSGCIACWLNVPDMSSSYRRILFVGKVTHIRQRYYRCLSSAVPKVILGSVSMVTT